MQPYQYFLQSTLAYACGGVLTFLALNGKPVAGNPELHTIIYVGMWLAGIVGYLCGRHSNR